jgi:hypothetical protein
MEEKETVAQDSIESILNSLLRSTNFTHRPIEISASPEEGVRLVRAFIRIKQPELRAAIITLATQIADSGAFATPARN